MEVYNIQVKWALGHTGIVGNEAADALADLGAGETPPQHGDAAAPTISGIRSIMRDIQLQAQEAWWRKVQPKLSANYKRWNLQYQVKAPPELHLPRAKLHRLLALRTTHGDFA
jgi:hypothetical protein